MKSFLVLAAIVAASAAAATPAAACACCSEHGERYENVVPIDDYTRSVLAGVKFADTASLFATEADWDDQIRGINNPTMSYSYHLKLRRTGTDWIFSLRDDKGNRGALYLAAATRMRQFAVDMKPETPTTGGYVSVKLYKEWEISGPISGTGIFEAGRRSLATGRLIFHGRGNGCIDPSQFTNWTLDVSGQGAKFRFFGRLK